MTEISREFGERVAGADYVLRRGGYAVIRRSTGEVAVVTTPRACYLPGGGQDDGETAEQAAVREALEECGLQIGIIAPLGPADQLVYSAEEATYFRKRCFFFLAEFPAQIHVTGDVDHVLCWVTPEDAMSRLTHESQRWAVAESAKDLSNAVPILRKSMSD